MAIGIEIKRWFLALRPESLIISLMTVMVGNALAYRAGVFSWNIAILTLLVTITLQLITNLSNDLGDYLKGTDLSDDRLGPSRHLEREELTPSQMKKALFWVIVSAIIVGGLLLYQIILIFGWLTTLLFLGIGISAIIAAITYTLGSRPYGYAGWGDPSAFLFFGPIGVMGIYFLQVEQLDGLPFIPAIAIGLLTISILNLNNIRDIDNDQRSGKITIAVRLGHHKARGYHLIINGLMLLALMSYNLLSGLSWMAQSYLLLTIPIIIWVINVYRRPSRELQPYLERTALSNFLLSLGLTVALIVG